jgi:hypothetical protein
MIEHNTVSLTPHRLRTMRLFQPVLDRAEFKADDEYVGYLRGEMRLELSTALMARVIDSITFHKPANWLEALKEDIYQRSLVPSLIRRRWPVRYYSETVTALQAFPDIDPHSHSRTVVLRYDYPFSY